MFRIYTQSVCCLVATKSRQMTSYFMNSGPVRLSVRNLTGSSREATSRTLSAAGRFGVEKSRNSLLEE